MTTQLLQRPCDGRDCVICSSPISSDQKALLVTVPSKALSKLPAKQAAALQIKWDVSCRSNASHSQCWEAAANGPKPLTRQEQKLLNSIEETIETFDSLTTVRSQVPALAQLLKQSTHSVCFTGSGVSASCGIATYRGAEGIDTVDEYTTTTTSSKKRKTQAPPAPEQPEQQQQQQPTAADAAEEEEGDVDYTQLQPSAAHRCLAALQRHGMMNYLVTQNCDGLHAKAGFPRTHASELHGNVFVEYCEKCLHEYQRDYCVDLWSTDCRKEPWYVRCSSCGHNHYTSRKCSRRGCRGKLRDTIVNFGDDLHQQVLGGLPRAESESAKADLCLCLGSSLTVTPAKSLPTQAKQLVICNLQETELDGQAVLRFWTTSDILFHMLFEELELAVPP